MARKRKSESRLRRGLGLTQKEIAKAAGVSERTVQRYEAGESSNEAVSAIYANLKVNRKRYSEIRYKAEIAQQRYRKLRSYFEKEGIRGSTMKKYYEENIGGRTDFFGKTENELALLEARLDKYLSAKTGTVEGYKKWEKSRKEQSGEEDRERVIDYWELFSIIRNNSLYLKEIKKMKYEGDISQQIRTFIQEYRDNGYDYDDILDYLKDTIEANKKATAQREAEMNKKIF